MTDAKAIEIPKADKLLNRIRELAKNVKYTTKKLSRQKVELYRNVFLFTESRCANGASPTEVWQELVKEVGMTATYWSQSYRTGKFARDASLDSDSILPSALSTAARQKIKKPAHLKKLAKLLNDGAGPTVIAETLKVLGYREGSGKEVPLRKKKLIRLVKKKWADFEPDATRLAAEIAAFTDKPNIAVHVYVHLDDSAEPIVVGEFERGNE